MIRTLPLLIVLSCVVACRASSPSEEPALEERAWGEKAATVTATVTDVATGHPRREPALALSEANVPPDATPGKPLARLRPDDPPSAEEQALLRVGLDALGTGLHSVSQEPLTRRLLVAWARRDTGAATALALALPEVPQEDVLGDLLPRFAARLTPDEVQALIVNAKLPNHVERRLLARCALGLARDHPGTARACHKSLGDRGDRVALRVAKDLASTDRKAAQTWVLEIRDEKLRDEAGAEVLAEGGDGDLEGVEGIEDDELRDWARTRALVRTAAERPHAALTGAERVQDPRRRAEVLEAVAWAWIRQGLPDLARQALKGTEPDVALQPLLEAVARGAPAVAASEPPRVVPGNGNCDALDDPHLTGSCRIRSMESAVARGDRDRARASLQHIADDAWRAAAVVTLFEGLSPAEARTWLNRSRALRSRLSPATRDRHLLALLGRCGLPPAARLRDGLTLIEDTLLRRQLIEEAGPHLSASECLGLLETISDPTEKALLVVTALEGS